MAKISQRKFSEILKGAIMQNSCRKTSVVECSFNKIAEIDSSTVISEI